MTDNQTPETKPWETTMDEIDVAITEIENRVDNAVDQLETATSMLHSVIDKLIDAETPGYWSEFTDEEAELAGAFEDDAITEEAAYEASFDNPEV